MPTPTPNFSVGLMTIMIITHKIIDNQQFDNDYDNQQYDNDYDNQQYDNDYDNQQDNDYYFSR